MDVGSDAGKRALQRAADLAGNADRIVVVAAVEQHLKTGIASGRILSSSSEGGDLEEAQRFLSERGVDGEPVEGQGDPGTVIVERRRTPT
jgi:nucleotide-binding universal stress UspA family protein